MEEPEDLRHADFRRIDLNLLVAFDALMAESHVGRAAARVFIGQPAMSHALARLRESLGDEVFIRSGNKMVPTALALELAPSVRAWLHDADRFLFNRGAFDPSRISATIRIGTLDGVEVVLLPALLAKLAAGAPGIRIWTKPAQREELLPALDSEEIDMAVGPAQLDLREWHRSEVIAYARFHCVYAPAQLTLPATLTAETLASQKHIALSWRGDAINEVDQFFQLRGIKREIAVSASSQLAICRLLLQFPFVTLQTSVYTSIYGEIPGLAVRPVLGDEFGLNVNIIWHRRNDKQPLQAYMRTLITDILREENSRSMSSASAYRAG